MVECRRRRELGRVRISSRVMKLRRMMSGLAISGSAIMGCNKARQDCRMMVDTSQFQEDGGRERGSGSNIRGS
jgi:hypothetical protein